MLRTVSVLGLLPARIVPVLGLLLAAAVLAEPQAASDARVLDLWLDGQRRHLSQDALLADATPAPDQDVRVIEIGRDAHTSHHVVAIRTGETLHRHDRHDLIVVLLRGSGSMRLGETTRPVAEGSVLYVPRGRVHAFTNGAGRDAPAFAHVIYAPPFDGEDRVPVPEPPPAAPSVPDPE